MLTAMRNSTRGLVAKIFLGALFALLIFSFAIWGIADIFTGYGSQSVAEVGDIQVSSAQFQAAYQRELSTMADRLGRQLTPDEARALGVDRRVLRQLLTSAALTNHARDLKLGVSDEYVAQQIVKEPSFIDAFGRFDRQRYESLLRYSGLSEAAYVAEQQRSAAREQLTETISGDLKPPEVLLAAYNDFHGAKRVVEYISLPAINADDLPLPGNGALTEFYNAREANFTTPELRALTLIQVEPADLTATVEVPPEDIKTEYEARRDQYETAEKRAVDQILFSSQQEADQAHGKITTGADFEAVASDAGFSGSDIDLGEVTQADIVDPKIAEAAFSLGAGEVSEPITGALGVAIIRVRSIEPGMVRPLAEVSDEIRDRLALDLAQNEVLDLYDRVEDERASGRNLREIGDTLNLKRLEIAATDRRGRDGNGEAVTDLPATPDLLREAFNSDVGVENDAAETASNGFIWFEVVAVTAPELKPFDTVRDDVAKLWREDQAQTRLRDQTVELVQRGNDGSTLAELAEGIEVEPQTSKPFTRRTPSTPFAPSLVEAVFSASPGTLLSGSGREEGQQVVLRIMDALPAEELPFGDADVLARDAAFALRNDLYEQYVSGLQARDGVSVNESALNALFGDPS